jgi:hypothetical protein
MKRFAMNVAVAAAAMTFAVGTVSAQTMKAEIPFAFRIGNQIMLPGAYAVTVMPGMAASAVVKVANYDARKSALAVPIYYADAPKAWTASGSARLRFECGDGACFLTNLWVGAGQSLVFRSQRGKNGEPRIAEITLRPERAGD